MMIFIMVTSSNTGKKFAVNVEDISMVSPNENEKSEISLRLSNSQSYYTIEVEESFDDIMSSIDRYGQSFIFDSSIYKRERERQARTHVIGS